MTVERPCHDSGQHCQTGPLPASRGIRVVPEEVVDTYSYQGPQFPGCPFAPPRLRVGYQTARGQKFLMALSDVTSEQSFTTAVATMVRSAGYRWPHASSRLGSQVSVSIGRISTRTIRSQSFRVLPDGKRDG